MVLQWSTPKIKDSGFTPAVQAHELLITQSLSVCLSDFPKTLNYSHCGYATAQNSASLALAAISAVLISMSHALQEGANNKAERGLSPT